MVQNFDPMVGPALNFDSMVGQYPWLYVVSYSGAELFKYGGEVDEQSVSRDMVFIGEEILGQCGYSYLGLW
jgi:hypothetical protein